MEIFEKIGDAASKTYKYTARKTSEIAKETKLKIKINNYKDEIELIYREIGEAVYEKFVVNEELTKKELSEKCEEIDRLTDKIVECKNEILKIKEKKQCKNCYEEIELNAHFCPNCGFEQKEEVHNENKNEKEDEKQDQEQENQETNEED